MRSRSAASAIASRSVAVGGGVHVVPGRASEAAGVGRGDGGEDVRGVRPVETVEHAGKRGRSATSAALHRPPRAARTRG